MILLYHLVFADDTPKDAWNAGLILRLRDFKRQVRWLKKHYQVVSLDDYLLSSPIGKRAKKKIAITFDDGYQSVFELVSPFLMDEDIPATFFVCTSHLKDGELLWFVYFNALCSEKSYQYIEIDNNTFPLTSYRSSLIAWRLLIHNARMNGDPVEYSRNVAKKYPLPDKVIRKYIGISREQLILIGNNDILDVGGHTTSHPYLDQIPIQQQIIEMQDNKLTLERITGKHVKYFAYTGGIYDNQTINAVKQVGFNAGFAIKPLGLSPESRYEIPRVDIYSPSMVKFQMKVIGVVDFARRLGLR